MVGNTFNPNTGKEEAGKCLHLRPAWSTEQVSGRPSLGSEGQKIDEDELDEDEWNEGVMFQPH